MADKKKPKVIPFKSSGPKRKPLFPHKEVGKRASKEYMRVDEKAHSTAINDPSHDRLNRTINEFAYSKDYKNAKGKEKKGLDIARVRRSRRTGV